MNISKYDFLGILDKIGYPKAAELISHMPIKTCELGKDYNYSVSIHDDMKGDADIKLTIERGEKSVTLTWFIPDSETGSETFIDDSTLVRELSKFYFGGFRFRYLPGGPIWSPSFDMITKNGTSIRDLVNRH
jgi:hypothetical protein